MAKKIGVIYLRVRTVKPADISAERRPIDWKPVDINYACLEVQDEGTGIADADIDNLFDPFFSSKATGRGLGLPLVLGIVKAHAGAVEVDSAPGRGSVFRVFLPTNVRQL
jgi:signal transduction histidine kinase